MFMTVIMSGDGGCGKSSLLLRFADDSFTEFHPPTIGMDSKVIEFSVDDELHQLKIWDPAGQERFRITTTCVYPDAHVIIIVYDATNRESFDHVGTWKAEADSYTVPCHLVANKSDLEDAVVSQAEGQALARDLGIGFTACSAKVGTNVVELFTAVTRLALHVAQARRQRLELPLVITVLVSRSQDGISLSALSISGAELGTCYLEDINASCRSALLQLRESTGVHARQSVKFVTQDSLVLPMEEDTEYEDAKEEVLFTFEKPGDLESMEEVADAKFASAGLHCEDICAEQNSITFTDAHGKLLHTHPELKDIKRLSVDSYHIKGVSVDSYPIAVKVVVRRRKPVTTISKAFKLDT